MADVSKIKLGSTTYNIKDANAARSDHTHSYLPLSGGTLTGNLILNGKQSYHKHSNLDRDGTAPSSDTWGNSEITMRDKDDERIGLINIQQTTANTMKMWITPRNENSSGTETGSGITLYITKDGTSSADIGGNTTITGQDFTFGNGTTGRLLAKTPSRTGAIITVGGSKKAAGDANGTAIRLGAGGATLIGGGEYADNRYNVGDIADGDETLYMGADGTAYIETNAQTIGSRKTFTFGSDGTFNSPSTIKQNGTAVSLSGHKHGFTPAGTIAVQTAGSTTSITPVSSKTVVTSASGATAAYASGNITFTDGSFGTGASVTAGTAVTVKTGDAAYKFTGTAGTTGA